MKHQLKTDLWSGDDCSILFLGISRQAVNCTNLAGLRQVLGDQTYIVSVSDRAWAKLVGADFNFITNLFKQSLLILRYLK